MTRAPGSTWAVTKGRDARGPFEAGAASPTRVRADLERAVQALGGDAVLLRGEHPAGREPHGERRSPAIEEVPCRHRGPATAGGTLVAAIGDRPSASVTAPRADEALGPPQPVQVVQAVGVGREPGLELPDGPRVVPARPGLERTIHALSLVRSDEYPPPNLRARALSAPPRSQEAPVVNARSAMSMTPAPVRLNRSSTARMSVRSTAVNFASGNRTWFRMKWLVPRASASFPTVEAATRATFPPPSSRTTVRFWSSMPPPTP